MINGGTVAILRRRNGVAGTRTMVVVVRAVGKFMIAVFEVITHKAWIGWIGGAEIENQKIPKFQARTIIKIYQEGKD